VPIPRSALTVARAAKRIPALKALPLVELLMLSEVVLLAREHYERLSLAERRRLMVLIRTAKGRPGRLSEEEHAELQRLVAKAAPRRFAAEAVDRVSPVGVPRLIKRRLAGDR
jgi:hypothetical protein